MPLIQDFFTALGYVPIDEDRMKYAPEDVAPLADLLVKIREYKERYEQVPEDVLVRTQAAEEEEKKRKQDIEKLQVVLIIDSCRSKPNWTDSTRAKTSSPLTLGPRISSSGPLKLSSNLPQGNEVRRGDHKGHRALVSLTSACPIVNL